VGSVLAVVVPLTAMVGYVSAEYDYLFRLPSSAISRSVYGQNPFIEAPEIARYLREHTMPADRVAILGSEPEILFYSERRSATGYMLMESHAHASMQDEMIREIEVTGPKYIVGVFVQGSWLARADSDRRILSWMERYLSACYDVTGVIDLHADGTTARWDADAAGYTRRSTNVVQVYRRRSEVPCVAAVK
jgi:hypothetical protein